MIDDLRNSELMNEIRERNDWHDKQCVAIEAKDCAAMMVMLNYKRFQQAIESGDSADIGAMFLAIWKLQHTPPVEWDKEPALPKPRLSDEQLELISLNRRVL